MTPKQKRFVEEYLIDLNATQSAVRAGYSKKNAGRIGPELLDSVVNRLVYTL
jgi:phage terminase small subunit